MAGAETLEVDLTDRGLYADGFPHELFTDLRRRGPIFRHRSTVASDGASTGEFWVLLSHPLVQQVSRDWEAYSANAGAGIVASPPETQGHSLVTSDPPEHTRLRKVISAGFTPTMIKKLDERIVFHSNRILDEVTERGGEVDFARDVAYVLPMQIIADIMGIPEVDRARLFGVIDTVFRSGDPHNDLTEEDRLAATAELIQYAQALGDEKRREPMDDVWSTLALAQLDDSDRGIESLSADELDRFLVILSIAGSETTRNALASGMSAFIEHPDQFDRLTQDPGLIDSATDEIIRWTSPVTMFGRQAARDVELAGAQVTAGERVTMWYPSANRDEDVFRDPFRFDIGRQPNPHVSFGGGGVHYCLGANLAKREVHIMFEQLCRRFRKIELRGPVEFCTPSPVIAVSVDRLPVRLSPR